MSQARVHRAKKARKEWTCGKCKTIVKVGEPVLSFSVGFRGREQRRCDKPTCYPTRSERESSMVASVYDAIDSTDWSSLGSLEDLQTALQDIATAMREVAEEYEGSEMYEKNEDLQQRAETLNSSADELEGWEPTWTEPTEEDKSSWGDHKNSFEDAHNEWLDGAREEAQQAADEAELP